jgi:hypothetical protein
MSPAQLQLGAGSAKSLLQKVLSYPRVPMGCFRTRPKATASAGLELRTLHQPSNAVPSHLEASGPQLPVDAWSAVEAAAGHPQLAAEQGKRKANTELADQAKPFGDSCSLAK